MDELAEKLAGDRERWPQTDNWEEEKLKTEEEQRSGSLIIIFF